jgi:putative peptidoglycan lipid II flippase
VKDVFSAMLPVVVGMSIIQMSAILDSLLAWSFSKPDDGGQAWCEMLGIPPLMEPGTASALYLGQRLYQFPLGVFGIALGTVLYPLLTQHAQAGAMDLLRRDLSRGIRIMLAVALPASAGLCVMSWPLTRALFERGEFDLEDTLLTSRMIAVYACGVWCFIGIAILNRAFYATGDRKTPMLIGLRAFLLNLLFNLLLIWNVGGVGLAMSSVLASLFQVCVTLIILNRRVGPLHWDGIFRTLLKGLLATVLMAGGCLLAQKWLPSGDAIEFKLMQLVVPCLVGFGIYVTVAVVLRMKELEELIMRP